MDFLEEYGTIRAMHSKLEFPYRVVGVNVGRKSHSSLGLSSEINLFSLASDGLGCIVGVGRSNIALTRAKFPMHVHPGCMEIHYCLRGSLTFATDEGEFRCMPGEIFLTQPTTPHRLVERKRGQRHIWLLFKFPARREEPILGLAPHESALMCRRLAKIDRNLFPADPRLRSLFQNLFDTCDNDPRGPFRTIKLKAFALMILLAILDCAERGATPQEPMNARLMEVIGAIRKNPAHMMSIEELAHRAALSESRFSFLFKQATGLPPHSFIVSCRMKETKRRLRETDDSISKIAYDMGFASPRHLAVQFRQFFDASPREFRASR